MIEWQRTVIREFSSSPRLLRWLENVNDNVDPRAFIDLFLTDVMDPRTCGQWGLDIWGRIVGVSPYISVSDTKFIGWEEADSLDSDSWNNAVWWNGSVDNGLTRVSNEMFRSLIFAKAAANLSDGSAASINQVLRTLFASSGEAWVVDNRDKTFTVNLSFTPTAAEISILQNADVLPAPAGVSYSYAVVSG